MFNFFIYHKYLNNLLMKNYILLSTILFMTAPLSVSAYTANQIASTGKCWIAINHSDESVSDFGGRMGNVPFDVRGNYDIAVDADGNLNITKAIASIYEGEDANFEDYSDICLTISGTSVKIANRKYIQPIYAGRTWNSYYGYVNQYKQAAVYVLNKNGNTYYCLIPARTDTNRPSEGDNDWVGTVTQNSDGSYTITMEDFYVAKLTYISTKAVGYLYDNNENNLGLYNK